jgi:uncharacterized membrane protein
MAASTPEPQKLKLLQSLRRNFIAGLFLLLPLIISIYVLVWLYGTITGPTLRILEEFYPELQKQKWAVWLGIAAFIFNITLVIIVGSITRYVIGRRLFSAIENLVERIPILNTIYTSTKQILEGFSPEKNAIFQKVVLVEFPCPNSYSIGFVTGHSRDERVSSEPLLNIFVPTTPNPTSGYLLLVTDKQVKTLNMSAADAMKLVISGGVVGPELKSLSTT